jgi:hypothetical protein
MFWRRSMGVYGLLINYELLRFFFGSQSSPRYRLATQPHTRLGHVSAHALRQTFPSYISPTLRVFPSAQEGTVLYEIG